MSPLPDSLLESVAAAAVREGLADALFTRLSTPIGRLLVVSGPEGVVRIAFDTEAEDVALSEVAAALGPRVIASDREMAASRDALSAYFEGGVTPELPVDLRLAAAPFRRAVLEQLRAVPRGATVSYGELAARAGNPKAARAVGTACARNPVPIIVPCHRVLPGTGRLGSYRGGPERKAALLELEGLTALRP
ncbi:methylated-DNA-[protein]-cysteine S-methyltransferase [Solirubrobacter pauli]|uniref:methylated-DNA--[protein]-cysteine S-methyltransferase n=1 Tax=Solirubrobacter pauli TaxID=166793 RepID=A0A660L669_9ACTN|nr:methylated-DNA--[protein]-cysteine S-methyltransferase [Solirubrobacter pauli]RKQ87423.1 methylated-DNA-[protein]-cysteine S-methyltransferase [Solirubrobacter pauli]